MGRRFWRLLEYWQVGTQQGPVLMLSNQDKE